jgi:putative peptidoglycan lipid II flippase
MGPAAVLLAAGVFVSRFMGLIRDKIISYHFGAGLETDLYNAAFVVPDFINYLLAGGYFSITLIPLLTGFFQRDEKEGWAFFSAVFCWVSLAVLALTGLAWFQAPLLARLSAPGLDDPAAQARLAYFLRLVLPAQICFMPGACFSALLYMRRQFIVPALAPLAYNGGIILLGLLFLRLFPQRGMEGFCWGVFVGAALGSFVLPWLAAGTGGLNLAPRLFHPGLKAFLLLALPLMLGQSIVALDEQLLRFFGSLGGEGAISKLNYARRIMMVPVGVVAQAAGAASYPFLAALAASGDKVGFEQAMRRALLTSLLVIIPLSCWMIAVCGPTIRLIFQQGMFSAQAAESTALLLAVMLCAAPLWAVQQVIGRGFYSHRDTVSPVLAGTAAAALSLPLYWLLTRICGAPGTALAGVCGLTLYVFFLLRGWGRRFGGAALRGLGRRVALLLALCAPCALAAGLGGARVEALCPARPIMAALLNLGASLAIFILCLLPLARLFAPSLCKEALETLRGLRKKHI